MLLLSIHLFAAPQAVKFNYPKPTYLSAKMMAWGTMYYLYSFMYSEKNQFPLLDMLGNKLGPTLDEKNWCDIAMEGSVMFYNTTSNSTITYNYAGKSEQEQVPCSKYFKTSPSTGKVRFKKSLGVWGEGYGDTVLIPYRSIAVDPKYIPLGSIVYIPRSRGIKVKSPTGKDIILDGYWVGNDIGGSIKGNHIDFYVGSDIKSNIDTFVTSDKNDTFSLYIVKDEVITKELSRAITDPNYIKVGDY